ncbi:membrane-spanning 4-domains subfamily A member 8-like [Engraulis encrasicolus]|uniref:membrane-spanning 4-domains subfamily A member 8-like n=1 Tax=Engraulis encrasicolus TaxID=184585 RepID=UPI002FD745E6
MSSSNRSAPVPLGNGVVVVTHVYREPDAQGREQQLYEEPSPAPGPHSWQQNGLLRTAPSQNGRFTSKLSLIETFVKREQTTLGTVQALIGLITIMFGIVTIIKPTATSAKSGVMFWGSVWYVIAGAYTVAGIRCPSSMDNRTLTVRHLGVVNTLSALCACIAFILFCVDLGSYEYGYIDDMVLFKGIFGVMLVLALVEFMISVALAFFAHIAPSTSTPEVLNNISSQEAKPFPPSYTMATTVNTSETRFSPSSVAPPSTVSSVDKSEDLPFPI